MKNVIASLAAVAGLNVAASAVGPANTRMDIQVSLDGTTFSDSINLIPNTTVQVRVLVSYIGPASEQRQVVVPDPNDPNGTATITQMDTFIPRGLSSVVFQPTVSGLGPGDVATAFDNGGAGSNTTVPSGVITNTAGHYGRVSPWGRTSIAGLTAFLHSGGSGGAPPGNWLRIAQPQVSNWIGGAGNTSGGSGVNIAQFALVGRTASDPAFNWRGTTNVVNTQIAVFRFGISIGPSHASDDTMIIDAPYDGFGNIDTDHGTGDRQAYWWGFDRTAYDEILGLPDGTNPGAGSDVHNFIPEATGSFRGAVEVHPAYIHSVPSPSPLALFGVCGMAMPRRRR